ncbi:MAG: hypothetical protein ACYC4U_11240 [Pirellulaceae bacterium]
MITFLDGPAEGNRLSLSRVPYFLRVVIDAAGSVDALDKLNDTIRDGEVAWVYYKTQDLGAAVYCTRGKGCRHVEFGAYQVYGEQPPQELLSDNTRWSEWATAQYEGFPKQEQAE